MRPWARATTTPPRRVSAGARRTLPESVAANAGAVSNTAPRAVSGRGTVSPAGGVAVVSVALRSAFSTVHAAASTRIGTICLVMESSTLGPGQIEGQERLINEPACVASISRQVGEVVDAGEGHRGIAMISVRRFALAFAPLAAVACAPTGSPGVVHAAEPAIAVEAREQTADQQVRHVLNRLAFGARPGDVDRVRSIGVDRWIAAQLQPSRIPDTAAEHIARALPTLTLSSQELLERY